MAQVEAKKVCPNCGSDATMRDPSQGEVVCTDCGLVIDDIALSKRPNWKRMADQKLKGRGKMGTPYLYSIHDKGLSTTISRVDIDAHGQSLPQRTKSKMRRLKVWQGRLQAQGSGRNLRHAAAELDRLSDRLSIPNSVKERAAIIYRKALIEKLVRGRIIVGIAAASVYLACRMTRFPRSLTEISEVSPMSKKDIARIYRLLLRTLDIEVPLVDPIRSVSKIISILNLSDEARRVATRILERAIKEGTTVGKDPMGVAAGAVYMACRITNEAITQKSVAEAVGVTDVTVRNRYRALKELDLEDLGLEIPPRPIRA
ncbi:MAG: transcription initiation factor IIB family protein [Candidatus Bathyarchaeia archaeon]